MVFRQHGNFGSGRRIVYSLQSSITPRAPRRKLSRPDLWQRWFRLHAVCRTTWSSQEVSHLANRPGSNLDARPPLAWICRVPSDLVARRFSFRWTADAGSAVDVHSRVDRKSTRGGPATLHASAAHRPTPHGNHLRADRSRAWSARRRSPTSRR